MSFFNDNKAIKNILIILLIGSVGFLLFITPLIVKQQNGYYCEIVKNQKINGLYATTDGITLDNNNEYVIAYEERITNKENILKNNYCFLATNNASKPLTINIIDGERETIGINYVTEGTSTTCTLINNKENGLIGIKCTDCNATDYLTIHATPSINEDININGVLSNREQTALYIDEYVKCRESIKRYFIIYSGFVALILFSIMIMKGLETYGGLVLK